MLPAALLATGAASLFSNGLSALGQSFVNKTDKDKSGGVSLDEFSSFLQAGQKVPSAGTSTATSTEAAKARFDKIDSNADGSLSADEVNTYNQQLMSQIQAALVELQQTYGAGNAQGGQHRKSLTEKFASIDTNADSAISKDELTAYLSARPGADATAAAQRADKLFSKIDTNNDGSLSKDEVSAFDAARKKKRDAQRQDGLAALMQAIDQVNASIAEANKTTASSTTTSSAASALAASKAYKAAA